MEEKIILDVPFMEKDEAKMLGAQWDPEIKKWFVPPGISPRGFAKWLTQKRDDNWQSSADSDRRHRNNKETLRARGQISAVQ